MLKRKDKTPTLNGKNKIRSYAGENDSQHIRALALGLDWHSSPRVTSFFTFHIASGIYILLPLICSISSTERPVAFAIS